jgi:hypothetical protein
MERPEPDISIPGVFRGWHRGMSGRPKGPPLIILNYWRWRKMAPPA